MKAIRKMAVVGVVVLGLLVAVATTEAKASAPDTVPRATTSVEVWADVDAGSLVALERTGPPVNACVADRLSDPLWLRFAQENRVNDPQQPTAQQLAFAGCFAELVKGS